MRPVLLVMLLVLLFLVLHDYWTTLLHLRLRLLLHYICRFVAAICCVVAYCLLPSLPHLHANASPACTIIGADVDDGLMRDDFMMGQCGRRLCSSHHIMTCALGMV
jgi:hypothetical protein